MPFDALTTDDITLNLIRGREAIERGWCKGAFRKRGRVCILGAIGFRGIWSDAYDGPEVKLLSAALLINMYGHRPDASSLIGFNDHYAKKRDVIALFDRAITLAKHTMNQREDDCAVRCADD